MMRSLQAEFKHHYLNQTSLACFHQLWIEQPKLNQTLIWLFLQTINKFLRKTKSQIYIYICWKNLKEIILLFNLISIQ